MSKKKKKFNKKFDEAVAQSFLLEASPSGLKERLLERLDQASQQPFPEGLEEEVLDHFQGRLSAAVRTTQEWAPEDAVALRTEAILSAEMNRDVLSERSVTALAGGEPVPESLAELEVDEDKLRFIQVLQSEVKRSSGELEAPPELHQSIAAKLKELSKSSKKVIPFPSALQWRRGLSGLTSLVAGFALVFLTLFGSTEAALANSVRLDHKNCCRMALAVQKTPPGNLKAMLNSKFGQVPVPPMEPSWQLRVSQLCHTEEGKPMVHLLYSRKNQKGRLESISFHFFPNREQKADKLNLSESELRTLSDDGFPVVGWLEGRWICTACSPDLNLKGLTDQVQLGL